MNLSFVMSINNAYLNDRWECVIYTLRTRKFFELFSFFFFFFPQANLYFEILVKYSWCESVDSRFFCSLVDFIVALLCYSLIPLVYRHANRECFSAPPEPQPLCVWIFVFLPLIYRPFGYCSLSCHLFISLLIKLAHH